MELIKYPDIETHKKFINILSNP
ncbi:chemotaxis protein, partial [Campylobacter jejuni]|nr:chemotaxis protein [Campylobacter jejuni]